MSFTDESVLLLHALEEKEDSEVNLEMCIAVRKYVFIRTGEKLW